MILLKNIEKNDNVISFTGYEEGKAYKHFDMKLDAETFDVLHLSCKPSIYTQQACMRIMLLMQESSELPSESIGYWN